MDKDLKKIWNLTNKAMENSYSPYSNFKVGAIIVSDVGLHTGTNIENASYGCTLCAEAVAIGNMISNGGKIINLICISSSNNKPISPCGMCRQRISEFSNNNTKILLTTKNKMIFKSYSIDELLPYRFNKDFI